MRLIFSIFATIVVLLAALIFIAPMFISTEEMRTQLFARVESMTGYRLRVSGPVDISLFPSIDLVANDVGIAPPSGEAELATAKTLRFSLMLSGLLQGNFRVKEITLIDPVIALPESGRAESGRVETGQAAAPQGGQQQASPANPEARQGQPAATQAGENAGPGGLAEQLKTITLDRLVIENGTVTLPPSDGKPGKRIEQLDLTASLPGFDEPLSLDTRAVVDGKTYEVEGSIGSFGQFLEGTPVPLRVLASAPGALEAPLNLGGTASYKDGLFALSQFTAKSGDKTLSGTVAYKDKAATLSQFTATLGQDTIAGNASYQGDVVTVNPLTANIRGSIIKGVVEANLANKVPYIVANFNADTLDIDALNDVAKSKPASSGGGGGGGGGSKDGGSKPGSAWSNKKIDFSPLREVNGKFGLTAQRLIYDQVTLSPVTLAATLEGGKLNATLSKFTLYDGAGDAGIAIDASGKVPAQRVRLSVVNFDAYPLLKNAADFERLEGRGTVSVDLSAYGASQQAIMSALTGNANLEFTNGAIRGVNIAKMVRNLGQGIVKGWQGNEAEKTDFASLGGTFQIDKGVAATQDLHLVGPLVRVNGSGTVNLPQKTLNMRVDPQLVASLEGQGGERDLTGLGVPIMITGPWSSPKFYPDIKGILENPQAAYERLKKLGDGVSGIPGLDGEAGALSNVIKDGKVDKDALIQGIGGLLGGNRGAPQQGEAAIPDAQPAAPPAEAAPQAQPDAAATAQPEAAPVAEPEPQAAAEPQQAEPQQAPKKKKKRQDVEDAAKQLLDNFLSGR